MGGLQNWSGHFGKDKISSHKNTDKIPFHPYFTVKDIVGFIITGNVPGLSLLPIRLYPERFPFSI
jgi:quinol-cytochrome oxidoreductase complex cytochrome b subunit